MMKDFGDGDEISRGVPSIIAYQRRKQNKFRFHITRSLDSSHKLTSVCCLVESKQR